MKYLKDIPRKFRNHFREENVYLKAIGKSEKKEGKTDIKRAKIPRRKLH